MERKGLYMDFLFSSKDKFKKFLEERVNKIKDIIKEIENKYSNNDKVNHFIYLYNPESQKIKAELFKVEIGKDNVNLYYRITFITKNLNKKFCF